MTEAEPAFSWRYATIIGTLSAAIAIAVAAGVTVAFSSTGNPPFAGNADATALTVVMGLVITPLLSGLVAFVISVFAAKRPMFGQVAAAIVLSWVCDVALGVPVAVITVVLTRPHV